MLELMIASTIGLIATTGVISLFVYTLKNNSDTLKEIRLHQELRAIMDVISRDIRRAGYWRHADGIRENPFGKINVSDDGSCITYSYDMNPSQGPKLGNEDNFGMRLSKNAVKLRTNSSTCDSTKYWQTISSDDSVKISKLNFLLTTRCSNISSDTRHCQNAETNDVLSKLHGVEITLSGELYDDSSVALTLNEHVMIRNIESSLQP